MSKAKNTTRTNYKIKINNTYLMFGIVVFVVGCILPLNVVLADGTGQTGGLELAGLGVIEMINEFVKVSSWLWVFLANIAGVFMTNSMVYGEALGMDIPLWKIWNVMKNFANYTLGFIFIASVFKTLFKGQPASLIKSTFPKLLASAVLIQASWFLMGAMIDVSNVAMGAAGSFVQEFIESGDLEYKGSTEEGGFKSSGLIPSKTIINTQQSPGPDKPEYITTENIKNANIMENFTPSYDNFSGPLLFMGYSIFRFHDYATIENLDFSNIAITTLLKLVNLIMFAVPLIILIIVNIMRVFWIWMAVMFAPFLILDAFFGNFISGKIDKFNIVSIIKLVFQPVVIIATMGLSLIILIFMYNIFEQGNTSEGDKSISMGGAQFTDGEVETSAARISIEGSMFKDSNTIGNYAGGMFGYLILSFFTVMLLWGVLKAGFKFSEITEGVANDMYDFSENMMKTVPLPGGVSIGSLQRAKDNLSRYGGPEDITSSQASNLEDMIDKNFGLSKRLRDSHLNQIEKGTGGYENYTNTQEFFGNLRRTIDEEGIETVRWDQDPTFRKALTNWWKGGGAKYIDNNLDGVNGIEDGKPADLDELIKTKPIFKNFLHTAVKTGDEFNYNRSELQDGILKDAPTDFKTYNYGKSE